MGEESTAAVLPTKKVYLDDTYLFHLSGAKVMEVIIDEAQGTTALVLDQTIFHPQGGGQPTDQGVIRGVTNPCTFTVSMVRNVDGKVLHYGKYDQGQEVLQAGEEVLMDVDEGRRRINARLHSAGHLIDAAVSRAGYVLKPTKGYHFSDGPYVEYQGVVAPESREEFVKLVNDQLHRLIGENHGTEVSYLTKAEAAQALGGESEVSHLDDGAQVRVVKVGDSPCPCGGTHVTKTSEIGQVEVTKIKAKKDTLRVSYKLVEGDP